MILSAVMFGSIGLVLGIVIFVSIIVILVNIVTSIWAYRDAQRKGKSKEFALIVLIGTLLFPILGLIVYVIIRND
ncbi:hypothetical protein ACFFGV_01285 [Pontibacillus salicampi]|uniref:Cardiolipin synthase N-terminal domain-containing protein n=1 Tax=Pontibacillus salicampi TaxID=1449801 RepID=A0ABV6LIK2_9BACI